MATKIKQFRKIALNLTILIIVCLALCGMVLAATLSWAAPGAATLAQSGGAPTVVAYQGQVQVSDTPFEGSGHFKFAVVNPAGDTSYWSNDGTSTGGAKPTATVTLTVSGGLFSVLLGDTSLDGMTQALTADAFDDPDRRLRVWFSSDGITFEQLAPDTRIAAVPYALQAERVRGYAGVVRVAKSGGDYPNVQTAIDSITTASADTPYLVWVAPGVYEEQVTMKPYVHLQGAGRDATVISSTVGGDEFPPTQATLVLTHHVSLRDLTVANGGTLTECIALLAPAGVTQTLVADVSARAQGHASENYAVHVMGIGGGYINLTLQNVDALAENATDVNVGLCNYYHSTLVLRGGTFIGRRGSSAQGISNAADDTLLQAENVIALAEQADYNYGLMNGEAVVSLQGGHFTARGGIETRGIYNYTWSVLQAEGVIALAEGGSDNNHGLENARSQATLHGGAFTARGGDNTRAIYNRRSTAELQAIGVTALAQDSSTFNYGLYNADEAAATLQGGAFTGQGGTSASGIYNVDANTTLETHDVAVLGKNASIGNRGMYNSTQAEAILHGGSFIALGGGSGIQNYLSATLQANNVFALAEGDGSYNQGLINTTNAKAILRGGSFIARDASYEARGIFTWGDETTLQANGILAMAENGDENYGIIIQSGSADLTQSTLEGSDHPVYRNVVGGSVITVTNSRLVGGDVFGTVTCVAVSWGASFYENTCP
jgi:hypothetical protein